MAVQIMDPITAFQQLQRRLTRDLISRPELTETFVGFGISARSDREGFKLAVLCLDAGRANNALQGLLNRALEAEPSAFHGRPEVDLLETGSIAATARPAQG